MSLMSLIKVETFDNWMGLRSNLIHNSQTFWTFVIKGIQKYLRKTQSKSSQEAILFIYSKITSTIEICMQRNARETKQKT